MPKLRFTSIDTRAIVASARPFLVGCRLQNIYDINGGPLLLKFQRKKHNEETQAAEEDAAADLPAHEVYQRYPVLLIEAGVRLHLTAYAYAKSAAPAPFTQKLRKELKHKPILEEIVQLGCDRVVELVFSGGKSLIVELYARGNVCLLERSARSLSCAEPSGAGAAASSGPTATESPRAVNGGVVDRVSVLQRSVKNADGGLHVGSIFDRSTAAMQHVWELRPPRVRQKFVKPSADQPKSAGPPPKGAKGGSKVAKASTPASPPQETPVDGPQGELGADTEEFPRSSDAAVLPTEAELAAFIDAFPKLAGTDVAKVHKLTNAALPFVAPAAVEAAIAQLGEPAAPEPAYLQRLFGCCIGLLQSVSGPGDLGSNPDAPSDYGLHSPGYLGVRTRPSGLEVYELFEPIETMLTAFRSEEQRANFATRTVPSFVQAVDEFFREGAKQRELDQLEQQKAQAEGKVHRMAEAQKKQISELQDAQERKDRAARLLEENVDLVDQAIALVRQALDSGIDWTDLKAELQRQRTLGHPIASAIGELRLEKNEFDVVLYVNDEDSDAEDSDAGSEPEKSREGRKIVFPIDATMTAHANVAQTHARRKQERVKQEKTEAAQGTVLIQAQKKLEAELKKLETQKGSVALGIAKRVPFWFEAFAWFVTSENCLVVAPKEPTQVDVLILRYAHTNDKIVGADVAGAYPAIVKPAPGAASPTQLSLAEAGMFVLGRSAAFSGKANTAAWWVHPTQLVDAPATGKHQVVHNFLLLGEKTMIAPAGRLELALGILFHIGAPRLERVARSDPADAAPALSQEAIALRERGRQAVERQIQAELSKQEAKKPVVAPVAAEAAASATTVESAATSSAPAKATKRGQKAKLKKLAKYAEQDDEEREIKMQLLGAKPTKLDARRGRTVSEVSEPVCEKPEKTEEKPQRACHECGSTAHVASRCPRRRLNMEPVQLPDVDLNVLVSRCNEEDQILAAVPVIAPPNAMKDYPLKVRFAPGPLKKGKCVQTALQLMEKTLADAKPISAQLRDRAMLCLKAVTAEGPAAVLPCNCRVLGAGIQELQKKKK